MSEHGIPIIEPTVDYTKVPAIHQKRTITFVNHFIIHTVTFLNKFALSCEEKLFEFENKLQKVEASLQILESRLSSIPGLEVDTPTETDSKKPEEPATNLPEVEALDNTLPSEPKVDAAESSEATLETQPISKDPLYGKFFKMLQFGVPAQAVKLKMKQEGLDPSILDDPDRRVPQTQSATPEVPTMTTDQEN